jgi:hypothetical protein
MYLAKTKDEEVEKLIHQALRETMDDMEVAIQTNRRDRSRSCNWKRDLGKVHSSNAQAFERAGRSTLALPRSVV